MQAAQSATDSDRPPPPVRARARRKRVGDYDPGPLLYSMGLCAKAMGVSVKTARRRLQAAKCLVGIGGRQYTTRSLLRRYLAAISPDFLARLEYWRERDGDDEDES